MTINGDKIYKDDYDYAFSKYEESFKRYYGETLDEQSIEKMKKDLIDDLIIKQIYLQEGRRRGITARVFAEEEDIEDLMMNNPVFYTNERFDEDKYEKLSIGSSLEIKNIRDRAENVILDHKLRQIVPSKVIAAMKEDISLNNAEVMDEYLKRAEKIKIKYYKVDAINIANNLPILDDTIRSYYNDHKEDFRRPAVNKFAVLYFDPDDFTSMVSISDDMQRQYYSENMDDYRTEKLVKAKYVLFRTKEYSRSVYELGVNLKQYYEENMDKFIEPAEARVKFISIKKPYNVQKLIDLEAGLKQNAPFSELARQFSDDILTAERGGDLGVIKSGTLKEPFNGIAFSLKNGETSDVIETDNGFYVISIDDKKEERIKPFMEIKDELEEVFLADSAGPMAASDAKRFRVEARRSGFEAAAGKKKKNIFSTDYFGKTERVPVIGKNTMFMEAAFGLASGEVSDPIEYDGGYVIMEVEAVSPQEYLPFEEVSKDIGLKITAENSKLFALSAAKHALSLIGENVPIKDIENRMNVHVSYKSDIASTELQANINKIEERKDGYYVPVFLEETPSFIPEYSAVSLEAAKAAAMYEAEKIAVSKAQNLLASDPSLEAAVESPYFSRNDYLIGKEYMSPLIGQCFDLKVGDISTIRSLNKYFVVKVLERGIELSGYETESPMIKSQVLREKRDSYVKNWFKQERERSQIQINI